jgi:hypothetical protein
VVDHIVEVNPDGTVGPIVLPTGMVHRITIKDRRADRVRLIGMFFDVDKCFLLPSAIRGIRKVRSIYDGHPGAKLLVVGHSDRSGRPAYNDDISLERSRAVIAYLTDDVDTWLQFYGEGIPGRSTTWVTYLERS